MEIPSKYCRLRLPGRPHGRRGDEVQSEGVWPNNLGCPQYISPGRLAMTRRYRTDSNALGTGCVVPIAAWVLAARARLSNRTICTPRTRVLARGTNTHRRWLARPSGRVARSRCIGRRSKSLLHLKPARWAKSLLHLNSNGIGLDGLSASSSRCEQGCPLGS